MRNIPSSKEGKLELLQTIMERELTQLQRQVLEDYFTHGLTMEQMARERGINPSAIYRTLVRAMNTIHRFLLLDSEDCKKIVNSPGKIRRKLAFSKGSDIISCERVGRETK